MKYSSISIFIILGFTSCKQKVDSINTAINMENVSILSDGFVGSWELKEWTAELTDGSIVFPYGEDVKGRITYDKFGNMAVQVMKNDRSRFLSEDPLQAQPNEVFDAYNGFIAYCGNYEVNPNAKHVIHQIKISSFPNWVGQDQIRHYEFEEDMLILSTEPIGSSQHKLTWNKMNN